MTEWVFIDAFSILMPKEAVPMDGSDEIIFTGEYKDFRLGVRFELGGREPPDAAGALAYISSKIEPHAFRFSGIDTGKISALAKAEGKGIGAVCAFLESMPPSALRSALAQSVPKPELLPAAESYLLNALLSEAGVAFKAPLSASLSPSEEEIGGFIGFIGKYKTWIAIKKLGLGNVQDYEVSGILSGINHTAVNKAFEFSGMKKDDSAVEAAARGKRRTYGNITLALRELEPKLPGNGDDAYLVCKTLEGVGYKPYASPEMLSGAYPDIKPPKVKGRKPKG